MPRTSPVQFRIGVVGARDLAIASKKYTTPVAPQTLNPEWNYSIDFKLTPQKCPRSISLTIWDKDKFGRDYLGELNIPISHVFTRNGGEATGGQPRHYDDPRNMNIWFQLNKRTEKQNVSGEVCLRFGLTDDVVRSDEEYLTLWDDLTKLAARI